MQLFGFRIQPLLVKVRLGNTEKENVACSRTTSSNGWHCIPYPTFRWSTRFCVSSFADMIASFRRRSGWAETKEWKPNTVHILPPYVPPILPWSSFLAACLAWWSFIIADSIVSFQSGSLCKTRNLTKSLAFPWARREERWAFVCLQIGVFARTSKRQLSFRPTFMSSIARGSAVSF